MSKYTMTIKQICDSFKTDNGTTLTQIIEAGRTHIFDFDYPFYDVTKKADFERMFIRHFFMREIGVETYALWKLYLQDWLMCEMPYYNKLFTVMEIQFNPLHDVDITKTRTYSESGESDGTSSATGSASRAGTDETSETGTENETLKYNKTPQGQLSNISSNKYLTEININDRTKTATGERSTEESTESESTGESHSENTKEGTETERITGKQGSGSYSAMLIEYQKAIIDMDNIVFAEMDKKLFMQIF